MADQRRKKKPAVYSITFRCHYPSQNRAVWYEREMALKDVARWLRDFKFTHPDCGQISMKIFMKGLQAGRSTLEASGPELG